MGKKQDQLNFESPSASRFVFSMASEALFKPIFANQPQRSISVVKRMALSAMSFCSTWAIRVFPFTNNALPTPFFATRSALATATRQVSSVVGVVRMPFRAMGFQTIFCGNANPSIIIFTWGNRLDMGRINASGHATKMVAV